MSAYAPIANPSKCPWGEKAFKGYFGEDEKAKWAEHDATELVKSWAGPSLDILIDVVCFHQALVSSIFQVVPAEADSMAMKRAPPTIFTNRASCCRKTL